MQETNRGAETSRTKSLTSRSEQKRERNRDAHGRQQWGPWKGRCPAGIVPEGSCAAENVPLQEGRKDRPDVSLLPGIQQDGSDRDRPRGHAQGHRAEGIMNLEDALGELCLPQKGMLRPWSWNLRM